MGSFHNDGEGNVSRLPHSGDAFAAQLSDDDFNNLFGNNNGPHKDFQLFEDRAPHAVNDKESDPFSFDALIDFDPPAKDVITDDFLAEHDGYKFEGHRDDEIKLTELSGSIVA